MSAAVHPRPQTRSLRVAANTARPLQGQQQPQQLHQASTSNHGAAVSSLSLFLTNLKLLDLDIQPGWPGISPDTFAATGVANAQSQKRRIQCVEWALFHLFALWDPEETANKLKPFFPPLDQVQSLNLRAALLRALEQAKKNGVLGRDAVLRKTMLDECKGERLEELLAAFSSAVLKKVVIDDTASSGAHPALALTLALESRGYRDDKAGLNALVLAHKVSLHRIRERKEVVRARFRDFSDLLGVKERGLARRSEETKAREMNSAAKTVSDDARKEMFRTVRNNWSGNERWMETLLYGDAGAKKDGPFGMPFDRLWRRVQQNRLAELESRDTGLLDQLDSRVRIQKMRLEKWQTYRTSMFCETPDHPSPSKITQSKQSKGIDLGFGAHEDLRLGRMSPRKFPTSARRIKSDYGSLLSSLKSELSDAENLKPNTLSFLYDRQKAAESSSSGQEEAEISEMSDLEDNEETFPAEVPIKSFQTKLEGVKRLPLRPNLSRPGSVYGHSRSPSKPDITNFERASPSPTRKVTPNQDSPTQALADQILQSMNQSPSPRRAKPRPTLSLTDRTRLSMAPRTSLFEEDDEGEVSSTPSQPSLLDSPTKTSPPSKPLVAEDPEEDLVARTRRSMAGFEKAKQKAQLERRRSLRRSKMPPRKEFTPVDEMLVEEQTIVVEELMGGEDMEAVFRSRPKIKASPLPSPTRELDAFDY